jgi:hypothetical protein
MAFRTLGLWHFRTRTYTHHTNRKAGRFIQTLCKSRAYVMLFLKIAVRIRRVHLYMSKYIIQETFGYGRAHPTIGSLESCGLLNNLMTKHSKDYEPRPSFNT